jgi:hypothetical protein
MKTYTFWYTEELTRKAGFQAENKEEAIKLLERVQSGEIWIDDLPNGWAKDKDNSNVIGFDTLREIEDV